MDPTMMTLIPIITGSISAAVQIAIAIAKFWQSRKDRRTQLKAYENTVPTSNAARNLQSLMDVQSSFWKSNPAMFKALGSEAARILKEAYSKSNGYLSQLAKFAGQVPEKMDWKSASEGIGSVNHQLRELFAQHLGKVISKMACGNMLRRVLLPKDVKDRIAKENAQLLMQAQSDLGVLMGQMRAGEEGTKRQIEWYEQQQAQQVQSPPPEYYQGQQPPQYGQPAAYQQQPVQHYYAQQQPYAQPMQQQQPYYVPVYQVDPQGHVTQAGVQTREEDKSDCIIS